MDASTQQFGPVSVQALRKGQKGAPVLQPSVSGKAAMGGTVEAGGVTSFNVDFHCIRGGVVPVLVVVPLRPAGLGQVSFKIVKVSHRTRRARLRIEAAVAVKNLLRLC